MKEGRVDVEDVPGDDAASAMKRGLAQEQPLAAEDELRHELLTELGVADLALEMPQPDLLHVAHDVRIAAQSGRRPPVGSTREWQAGDW